MLVDPYVCLQIHDRTLTFIQENTIADNKNRYIHSLYTTT